MTKEKQSSFWRYKFDDWSRDFTSLANPLILLFVPFIFLGAGEAFYTLLLALVINEALGSIIKIIFPKKRPDGQSYNNLLEKIDAGSFPSLHAARISLVYLTMFAHTDNLVMKILFLTIIAIVMVSRIHLKKHFWIDVIAGGVMGSAIFAVSRLFM